MTAPNPEQLHFAKTHEWVRVEEDGGGKVAVVGISAFAVEQLTDLVYLELPQAGRRITAGDPLGEIESVKAVSDVYAPVSGEIVEVNSPLADKLEMFNDDPYGAAWMVKVKIDDESELGQLMDYATYQKQCAEEG